jgi:hypothetical protein
MLRSASALGDETSSMKSLLVMMGNVSVSSDQSQSYSDYVDEPENMEAMITEVSKRFEEL